MIILITAAIRATDRLSVASALLAGAAGLLLLLAHGPWLFVPAWIWSPLAGVCVAFAGLRRAAVEISARLAWCVPGPQPH